MWRNWTAIILLFVLSTSGAFYAWSVQSDSTKQVVQSRSSAPKKPIVKTEALDPLEIDSIRNKKYVSSRITDEGSVGEKAGYHESVVSFTSDSYKEYALMAIPSSPAPSGGYPVILLVHGYIPPTEYRTVSNDYRDWIAVWAKAGFVVIKPDLRGNGSSQGPANSGHYSPEYTYDVLNLIASLKHYKLVDSTRIGVAGHSMGGHIALRVAVVSPDVKATTTVNGVVGSMNDFFFNWPRTPSFHDKPTATVKSQLEDLIAKHGNPKTNPEFWEKASAINYVQQIKGVVQINHDTADSVVPLAFSQHLNDALVAAHKPVTFYQYPGDDHQFANPSNHSLLLQRTTDFFLKGL